MDETDLSDAFMSAAYVPGATAFKPPGFRGETIFDAAFVDTFFTPQQGNPNFGFHANNPSIFPPARHPDSNAQPRKAAWGTAHANQTATAAASGAASGTSAIPSPPPRVVVVPNQPNALDPRGLVVIKGRFKQLGDFFADFATMRAGFVQGYEEASALVDTRHLPALEQAALAGKVRGAGDYVDAVLARHAAWREPRPAPAVGGLPAAHAAAPTSAGL